MNLTDAGWMDYGACKGKDANIFYPEKSTKEAAEPAKQICKSCLVKNKCLSWALLNNERLGIWGGKTEAERAGIQRAFKAGKRPKDIAKRYGISMSSIDLLTRRKRKAG